VLGGHPALSAPVAPHPDAVRVALAAQVVQLPAPRPLATRIVSAAKARSYTIVSGDTLTGIAGRFCHRPAKWPSLFNGNRKVVRDPDLIYPGQKLTLVCDGSMVLPATVQATVRAPVAQVSQTAAVQVHAAPAHHDQFDGHRGDCGDGDGDGMDAPCSVIFPQHVQPAPAPQRAIQATATVTGASGTIGGTFHGSGTMQACIIARESGGNSQVVNASGHYGLYQFSASTWSGSGGNPADFGHASVAEQNQVFQNAVAARGYSDWTPYDGC
jgi:LysM repeat protein